MLTALVAAAIVQDGAVDGALEFEARGERLDAVVERLAEATGQALVVGEEGSSHHLAIFNKTLTADELIAGIARVTASQWIPDRGAMRLVPDRQARDAAVRERIAARAESFPESVAAWKELAKVDYGMAYGWNPSGASTLNAPRLELNPDLAFQMADVLLDHIDPMAVARLGDGERIVFSTQPNAKQTPIRSLSAAALRDLSRRYKEFSAEFAGSPHSESIAIRIRNLGLSDFYTVPTPESEISKIVISVGDSGAGVIDDIGYQVRVIGFTLEEGRHKQMFSFILQLPGEASIGESSEETLVLFAERLEIPEEVTFDPAVVDVVTKLMTWVWERTGFEEAPLEVQQYLLNRVANNPREQIVSPLLESLSEANDIDVIALLPESAYSASRSWVDSTSQGYAALSRMTSNELVDGVLYSMPLDVERNVAVAIDDRYLEEFLKENVNLVSLPLRTQIQYIAQRGHWEYPDPALSTVRLVFRYGAFNHYQTEFKLLSYASELELDGILREGEFRIGDLSPVMRSQIEKRIYDFSLPVVTGGGEPSGSRFEETISLMDVTQRFNYRVEPTELLPNGLPGQAIWQTRMFEEFGFIYSRQAGDIRSFGGPIDIMGLVLGTDLNSDVPFRGVNQLPSQFQVGDMTRYHFRLRVTDGFSGLFNVAELPMMRDAPRYGVHEFPEHVQREIERIRTLMDESGRFSSGIPGGGGSVLPPL